MTRSCARSWPTTRWSRQVQVCFSSGHVYPEFNRNRLDALSERIVLAAKHQLSSNFTKLLVISVNWWQDSAGSAAGRATIADLWQVADYAQDATNLTDLDVETADTTETSASQYATAESDITDALAVSWWTTTTSLQLLKQCNLPCIVEQK